MIPVADLITELCLGIERGIHRARDGFFERLEDSRERSELHAADNEKVDVA